MSCTVINLNGVVVQAIQTRFMGATNRLGSRIKATAASGCASISVKPDHSRSIELDHAEAAMKLAAQLGWAGNWIMGGMWNDGYIFVRQDVKGN